MALSTNSEFIDSIKPLGDRLKLYDPTRPPTDQPRNDAADPARAIPQGFIDAMIVRHSVYVKEQGVPLENELDDEDHRSFHWTAYASMPAKATKSEAGDQAENPQRRKSTSTKVPIGTIRLVPPPHHAHPNGEQNAVVKAEDDSYVKLGRLAVIKEFRGVGIPNLLIHEALEYIRDYPNKVPPYMAPGEKEQRRQSGASEFNGLVLIHAQAGLQKWWARFGFVLDESMGTWDEEGIPHVGMWKKIDVKEARRKSKILLPGIP